MSKLLLVAVAARTVAATESCILRMCRSGQYEQGILLAPRSCFLLSCAAAAACEGGGVLFFLRT